MLDLDPYRPSWSRDIVIEKLGSRKNENIGIAILDQSVIAGIGNILRNEILYRAKINPESYPRSKR